MAAVADAVGDRAGTLAFDHEIRRSLSPRRAGGAAVVQALFDLEPRPVDSDYELAFRHVGETKRAFVLVLTDLLDETAARPLAAALPLLARRHALAVASATDVDLEAAADGTSRSGSRRSTAPPLPPRCSRRGRASSPACGAPVRS